ncbi:NTP transferase domain-containing protein [Rhodococcus sp. NPDC047139]|uniref:NTP transferase domain-containing protein n=1 Tax=Rhodococcus sp. NPDC047139 TaxID=3155141 RepID=UPI0033D8C849
MSTLTHVEAVIVAGGRATRMGGVDKPALTVGGRRMLDTALAAVDGCARVTVVGPYRDDLDPHVLQIQETPPGAGPLAALAAADPVADLVVVLAADLPFITPTTVTVLLEALNENTPAEAAFAVDDAGRLQFLLAAWRTPALAARLSALTGDVTNRPMKSLLPERYVTVVVSEATDCDTPDDLHAARTENATAVVAADPDEARRVLRESLSPLPSRTSSIEDARNATLAAPLVAAEALPRLPISAMDGYAVAGDAPWLLRDEIRYAGDGQPLALRDGEAARIATGAHLPIGATAAVRDEFVRVEGGLVTRLPDAPVRNDARRRGEDWEPGAILAEAGTAVGPAIASVAASGEVMQVQVRGPLRVHIALTGDEIRRTGPLREGQTRDSLGPVLPDFVRWCGAEVTGEGHLRDTAEGFDALFAGTDADAIVIVGATGGGAADQLRAALTRADAQVVVERVRCKPGGSQVAATLPDGRAVLGLPGNPVAAVSTLLVMLPAIVEGRTLRTPSAPLTGALANASEVVGEITRLLPARQDRSGLWWCDNAVRTAHLAGLIGRTAIAVVPPGISDGDLVELFLLPH